MGDDHDFFLSLKVNQSVTRAALYQCTSEEDEILIYTIIDNVTYPKFEIPLNSPCPNNFSFLPADYGDVFIVMTNDNLLLYQLPEETPNVVSIENSCISIDTRYPITEAKCLKVSFYPPDLYFGYIQSNNIYVYLLESIDNNPHALPIRRYIPNDLPFQWFDFKSNFSIYCATHESIQQFDLNQSAILSNQKNTIKFPIDIINEEILFVDANINPVDPNVVAVLFKCLTSYGEAVARCGIAHFSDSLNRFDWISENLIPDSQPKTVHWSSFGSNIIINGSKTHLYQKNCAQDQWVLKEKVFQ